MTANPLRGEVELKVGKETHILRLGVTAMMLLEREFGGTSLPQIMQDRFADPKNLLITDVHKLFWAAMQRKGSTPSKEEVAAIMDEADLQDIGALVGELLSVTFAKAGGKSDENPPNASQESTGEN